MRNKFSETIYKNIKKNKNIFVVAADISPSGSMAKFQSSEKNFINVGVAEQNMIGVAAGLSSEGYNVVTTTFAPFQVIRCCEQIKVNIGYMKQKISMVGIASGLVLGNLGYTHCCIEDIGILRSIPNIQIISPADSLETVKAFEACLNSKTST